MQFLNGGPVRWYPRAHEKEHVLPTGFSGFRQLLGDTLTLPTTDSLGQVNPYNANAMRK